MTATAVRLPPALPVDPDLPDACDLLAGAGAAAVSRLLAGRGLEPQRIEPAQAHYRPGRWLAVCFRTQSVDRASGAAVGLTVTVDRRAGEPEAVWAFPDDPALPGLAAAVDGAVLRRRLRPRPAEVTAEPLRYRPRRRAVVRYQVPGHRTFFAKVVTPRRGRDLLALADALRAAEPGRAGGDGLRLGLPVGRLAPGALVVPLVPGTPLRDLLWSGAALPPPSRLAGLSDAFHARCLPAVSALSTAGPGRGRPAGRGRVDPCTALTAARVVARLLPDHGCAAGRVAEAIVARAEESDPPDEMIVHGDLYENQVLVDGERFGLIDLDDVGPGDPLLDAANFSAHLLLLGTSGTPAGGLILRYRDELRAAFCRRLDAGPAALAWREAYCLLRLASGPFRVLHPEWPRRMAARLALASEVLPGRCL